MFLHSQDLIPILDFKSYLFACNNTKLFLQYALILNMFIYFIDKI